MECTGTKNNDEMKEIDLKNRKKMMRQTSVNQRRDLWRTIMFNCTVAVAFYSYFIFTYVFHQYQLSILHSIQTVSPLFYQRYSDLYLSYAFLRERIINNNSDTLTLQLFLPDYLAKELGQDATTINNIENYYHLSSMNVESQIA